MPRDIYGQLKCGQCGTQVYVDQARYITAGGTPLCDACYFRIVIPPRKHHWYAPLTEGNLPYGLNLLELLLAIAIIGGALAAAIPAARGGALALRLMIDDAVNYAGIPSGEIEEFAAEMGRYEEFGSIEEKAGVLVRTVDEWKARFGDGQLPPS